MATLSILLAVVAFASVPLFAETEGEAAPPVVTPPAVTEVHAAPPVPEKAALVNLGVRFDAAFLGGDPAQQGFSIPSLRLTAFGDATPNVSYRVSLGQTREFSSVMLPQMLPVEAFVKLDSASKAEAAVAQHGSICVGMFTPSLNPWWTPDLGDVPLPDYNAVDKLLLLSRDIGAEASYTVIPDRLEFNLGIFNGSGIVPLNTNNARAFTGMVRAGIPLGDYRWVVGMGGYYFSQSDVGSVNYRSQWVVNPFTSLEYVPAGLFASAEGIYGHFDNGVKADSPEGNAFTVMAGPGWFRGFFRYERVTSAPTASTVMKTIQFGPLIAAGASIKLWALYQWVDAGALTTETSFLIRLRFVL